MKKMDKILFIYSGVFFIFLLILIPFTSVHADEGTHALLALFYKDMIVNILNNLDFSFEHMYDFGISYLVHYPKLQVFYPPMYHLITGLIFYPLFGISIYTIRLVNVIMATLTIIVFYFVTKKIFNPKTSLISTVLFSLLPITIKIGRMAMMEFTTFLFLLLSLYFYLETFQKKQIKYYILTAIFVFLALMSKRAAFFLIPIYSLHILYRKEIKEFMIFIILVFVLSVPYLLLILKINGIEISSEIYSRYAFEALDSWTYFFKFPFLLLFIYLFSMSCYKKWGEKEKFFMLWFIIYFVGILFFSFKPRYFIYFLIPVMMFSGHYFHKIKKIKLLALFLIYIFLSLFLVSLDFHNYPEVEETSYEIYETLPENGNVGMFSEDTYTFSSSFIFHIAKLDQNKTIFFYRPCTFYDKTGKEIMEIIEKNNIYYIISIPESPGYENINKIKNNLELIKSDNVELYKINNFRPKPMEYCNYICLTQEKICTTFISPFDVYSS
jgi:4-amino-4-deoxy-L-arabinose transferase-like glycosyltransferase